MKLIKEFDGVDLAVSKVLRSSLWTTPTTIYDEHGELVELKLTAMDDIAVKANLGSSKNAVLMAGLDQPRWKRFGDIFAASDDEDDTTNLCFTDKAQTCIYSFLVMGLEAETDALAELFTMLDDKQVKFIRATTNNGKQDFDAFVAIDASPFEQESPTEEDVEMIYMYIPETQWMTVIGRHKNPDLTVSTMPIYDGYVSKRKKKDKQLTLEIIEPDYAVQLLEDEIPSNMSSFESVRPSLQEVIMTLRTIQMTNQLVTDPSEFLGIFIERYSSSPKAVTKAINALLSVMDVYAFYYANGSILKDKELLDDPIKDSKSHLYFADGLRLATLFNYLNEFIKTEYDYIRKCIAGMDEDDEDDKIDVAYYISLIRHLAKRIAQPLEKYDEVKIPAFYPVD